MNNLMQGYSKFRKEVYPFRKQLFDGLRSGQTPETLIVCCSDSRVDLNLVTQAEPGDVFYVRNAGNLIPPPEGPDTAAGGAIEYAVGNLPIRDIVVCGHSDCGAMKALNAGVAADDPTIVGRWLRLAAAQTPDATGLDLDSLIRANVIRQLDALRQHDFIAERVERDELRLWGWVYDIGASELLQLDASSGEFRPLESFEPLPVKTTP